MGLRHRLLRLMPAAAGPGQRRPLSLAPAWATAWLLMLASGFAGLGYQIVWTQQSAVWLGHEAAAVLAVVAAFFGGLALGGLALGPRIERSARPLLWYAGCELAIAAWALLLLVLMPPFGRAMLALTGVQPDPVWQWAVAFTGTWLLLLPATAAMGATLPAMARITTQIGAQVAAHLTAQPGVLHRQAGQAVALLYAGNTLGAVLGVLACAFWLVPAVGLDRSAGLCLLLNLLCAGTALWWWWRQRPADAGTPHLAKAAATAAATTTAAGPLPHAARRVLLQLAATGALGIGHEVLVVRVLSQVAEDTVYTFALLLAVYLVGTALGAAAWQRWLAPPPAGDAAALGAHAERLTDRLLAALAGACLLGTASLWGAEALKRGLLALWAGADHALAAALATEAALALAAFLLPTLVMGALFSQLSARASAAGLGFGRALGVNTLGAALAPLGFGVLLAPAVGPKAALLAVAAGYLLLTSRSAWRRPGPWLPAAGALALALWAPPLAFVDLPEGSRLVSYQDGAMAAVSVVEDSDGVARLRINNRQQEGSSASGLVDGRQALLPLLLHPAPKRLLFLGLGTGVTAATAAQDPTLQVDAVELLPEVIAASAHFRPPPGADGAQPRLHILAADARRYVRASAQRYDVIVSDNFHPARSGSGALYTTEHFSAVRGRLADGGLFCQWLPLHQLDLATLRSIVRSFLAAYPDARAILASNSLDTPVIGLLGQRGDGPAGRHEPAQLHQRLAQATLATPPAAYGIADEWALLGSYLAGPSALARWAGTAPANTDDHPVVAYRAPRITYAPDSQARDRLLALLAGLSVTPADVLAAQVLAPGAGGPDGSAVARRLAAYWAARDRFIAAGRTVRPAASVQAMLDQVAQPLLAVLRTSADFRPAYDPLLHMAVALAPSDPATARALLAALAQIQPARPEAADALRQTALPRR